jgi:hypothetical protein
MSASQIANGQRAAHALDGINAHARSSAQQERGMREEMAGRDCPGPAGRPLNTAAGNRLAAISAHVPGALNQANGRQHR